MQNLEIPFVSTLPISPQICISHLYGYTSYYIEIMMNLSYCSHSHVLILKNILTEEIFFFSSLLSLSDQFSTFIHILKPHWYKPDKLTVMEILTDLYWRKFIKCCLELHNDHDSLCPWRLNSPGMLFKKTYKYPCPFSLIPRTTHIWSDQSEVFFHSWMLFLKFDR